MGDAPTPVTARLRAAAASRVRVDARALAGLRIALGAVLVVDLLLRSRHLVAFYTDTGVLPRSTLAAAYPLARRLSIHAVGGGVGWQAALFVVAGVAALALLAGYRTRVAAAVSLLLLLSLHARNPLVLNAGDSLLRQLLFWGLFLPLDERWSLDARRRDRAPQASVAGLATAALLLQVVVVYAVNAVLKLRGEHWLDGTAMQRVFSLDQFTILLGDALDSVPAVLEALGWLWLGLLVGSWLLVALRGRLRGLLAAGFALGHLGMALTMRLAVFPYVSIAALLPFVPSAAWDRIERRVAVPLRTRIGPTVASRLDRLASAGPSLAAPATVREWGDRLAPAVVAVGLAVMLGYNGATLAGQGAAIERVGAELSEPRWSMFAPNPLRTDGWFVTPARLQSGDRVDAFGLSAVRWDRPPDVSAAYPDSRWRKYLTRLRSREDPRLRRGFAGFLCARWNGTHEDEARSVAVYFLAQPTRLSGPEPIERRPLGAWECDDLSPTVAVGRPGLAAVTRYRRAVTVHQ
jgi:hypothetical protein